MKNIDLKSLLICMLTCTCLFLVMGANPYDYNKKREVGMFVPYDGINLQGILYTSTGITYEYIIIDNRP